VAEDRGKEEEEKFDFTAEGEGYISLDEARVLAMQTANSVPGDYGSAYQGVNMVFEMVEHGEDDDFYYVTLSFRPQGSFDGTPGQEQFVIGKDGTIAVRQVLSSLVRKGGGFPVSPVAIGLVVVGAIAAVGAVFARIGRFREPYWKPTSYQAPPESPRDSELHRRVEVENVLNRGTNAACPKCGAELVLQDNFCRSCGAPILEDTSGSTHPDNHFY